MLHWTHLSSIIQGYAWLVKPSGLRRPEGRQAMDSLVCDSWSDIQWRQEGWGWRQSHCLILAQKKKKCFSRREEEGHIKGAWKYVYTPRNESFFFFQHPEPIIPRPLTGLARDQAAREWRLVSWYNVGNFSVWSKTCTCRADRDSKAFICWCSLQSPTYFLL